MTPMLTLSIHLFRNVWLIIYTLRTLFLTVPILVWLFPCISNWHTEQCHFVPFRYKFTCNWFHCWNNWTFINSWTSCNRGRLHFIKLEGHMLYMYAPLLSSSFHNLNSSIDLKFSVFNPSIYELIVTDLHWGLIGNVFTHNNRLLLNCSSD